MPATAARRSSSAPQFGIGRNRRRLPALYQGPDILAGTAAEYRQPAAAGNPGNGRPRQRQVLAQTQGRIRRADVNQIMTRRAPFCGSGLGRADVHTRINLAAVGIDDFAIAALRQRNGQGGLAHRGGANDGNQWQRR